MGYIYILTNESFPKYVKIGYADDVEKRRKELSRSTGVPTDFKIFATYKVNVKLVDIDLHKILDNINPDLRLNKKKEFFELSPERAFEIFTAIKDFIESTTNEKVELKKFDNVVFTSQKNEIKTDEIKNFKTSSIWINWCDIPKIDVTNRNVNKFLFLGEENSFSNTTKLYVNLIKLLFNNNKEKLLKFAQENHSIFSLNSLDFHYSKVIYNNWYLNTNLNNKKKLVNLFSIINYCNLYKEDEIKLYIE